MARTFNGTTDLLISASPLALGSHNKVTVALWVWLNTFATDFHAMLEYPNGAGTTTNGFDIIHNWSSNEFRARCLRNTSTQNLISKSQTGVFATPAQWNHLVLTVDRTVGTSTSCVLYANGSVITPDNFPAADDMGSTTFDSGQFVLMNRAAANAGAAGRSAECAIWGGVIFTGAQVTNLYNAGAGRDARDSTAGVPTYYWQICGDASPEPEPITLAGPIALTVSGTTKSAAHPISGATICAAEAPPATGAERGAGSRSIGVYSPRGTTQPAPSGWA